MVAVSWLKNLAQWTAPFLQAPPLAVSSEPDYGTGHHDDAISQAVAEARFSNLNHRTPSSTDRARALAILDAHRSANDLDNGLHELLALVKRYPDDEHFQILAARLLDSHQDARAPDAWRGVNARFSRSGEAFRQVLRWAKQDFGQRRAQTMLFQRYPEQPNEPNDLIVYALACEELRNTTEADECYLRLEEMESSKQSHYFSMAGALRKRGDFDSAIKLTERMLSRFGNCEALTKLSNEIRREIENVKIALPNISFGQAKVGVSILSHVLGKVIDARSQRRFSPISSVGSVVMMNSSLGCGGAERQFVNTATALQSHINTGGSVADADINGPVNVICRSLRNRSGADFFLRDLERQDILVMEYADTEQFGPVNLPGVSNIQNILHHLPPQMSESLRTVPQLLGRLHPDILHIWQDGNILAHCVSALMSDAARIVLSVRSVPPIDRPERNVYDYHTVYRMLLMAKGVSFTSNSEHVARRYSEWLDIDPSKISVIHNGVRDLSPYADASAKDTFDRFDKRTHAGFCVGTVLRFDDNKRPYLWLDAAAKMLADKPECRFIMVGDGPLAAPAKEYAERLGISSRILFTGRSENVGYWLSKMDAFLLLSRFEGLPNALIEAQLAGLPVIATHAGGVAEIFIPGKTGTLLPNATPPSPAMIAAATLKWNVDPVTRHSVAASAKAFAKRRFAVETMLERTVGHYLSGD